MRSRSNGGVIGAYALPNQNRANGVFFIHDAAIFNTGLNPIWPLAAGLIYSATGGTITNAVDNNNYKLHTFTANGTFTVTTGSAFVDIFLVGGGGAGGWATNSIDIQPKSGGGGAGGAVILATNVWVNSGTTFTVEVGTGGTASVAETVMTDAVNSGKPSRVTSSPGYSYYAPAGGWGEYNNNGNRGAGSTVGGGGVVGLYTGSTLNASTRLAANGSPGTTTTSTTSGGRNAIGTSGGNAAVSAGGGAGWTNGYDGNYSFDVTLAGAGGDGYQWSRTGYYYGAGGPGGHTYDFPSGTESTYPKSGKYYTGSQYNSAWAYNNQTSSNNGGSASGGSGYGVGGGGGAVGREPVSGTSSANGGAGTSGTVIFCYRYR